MVRVNGLCEVTSIVGIMGVIVIVTPLPAVMVVAVGVMV